MGGRARGGFPPSRTAYSRSTRGEEAPHSSFAPGGTSRSGTHSTTSPPAS